MHCEGGGFIRSGLCGVRDSRRKTADRFRRERTFGRVLDNVKEETVFKQPYFRQKFVSIFCSKFF